jgi:hypothetical protein
MATRAEATVGRRPSGRSRRSVRRRPHPEAGSVPSRSSLPSVRNARRGKTPVRRHRPPSTAIPGARRHHRPVPRSRPRAPRPPRSLRRPRVPHPTRFGRRLRGVPRFPGSLSERGRLGGGPPILGTSRSTAPGQLPGGRRRAREDSTPPRGPPKSRRMPAFRPMAQSRRRPGSRGRPATPSARQCAVVSTPRLPGLWNDPRGLRPTRWHAASSIRRHP